MRAPCVRCDFLLERLPSDSLSDSGFRRRRAFPLPWPTSSNKLLTLVPPPPPFASAARAKQRARCAHDSHDAQHHNNAHASPKTKTKSHTHCALRLLSLSGHPSLLTYLLRSFNFGPTVACRSIKATDRTTPTHWHFSSHSANELTAICN